MSTDDVDEIAVLAGLAAVRRRPSMYVGDPSNPDTLACLVVQSLCLAADELAAGTATRATVTLGRDAIVVEDDGVGVPVEETPSGLRAAEVLFSALTACRLAKADAGVGRAFCGAGIVGTNALSTYFEAHIARDGEAWFVRYERGERVAPMTCTGPTAQHGTRLVFRPDPTIFGDARVDPDVLRARLDELAADASVTVRLVVAKLRGAPERWEPQAVGLAWCGAAFRCLLGDHAAHPSIACHHPRRSAGRSVHTRGAASGRTRPGAEGRQAGDAG